MIRQLSSQDLTDFESWAHEIPQSVFFNWSRDDLLNSFEKNRSWGLWKAEKLSSVVNLVEIPETMEILWLATKPQSQGHGLMRRLMTHLIINARSRNDLYTRQIVLEVHEMNLGAIKLYSSLGFTETRRRKNYYQDGASAVLMTLKIG